MTDDVTGPLPFIVLTGFLGSGKTTLLNRALADPALGDSAVLINEFGAVGLDHLLVASFTEDVALLESGCVCCGVGDDLGAALQRLLERRRSGELPPFRRVLLETSGIADPGPLQQRVLADPELATRLRIERIVTVVDVPCGERNIAWHLECATQIAVADILVLTKLDLADAEQRLALERRLRSLNPTARLLAADDAGPSAAELFGPTESGLVDGVLGFVPLTRPTPPALAGGSHAGRYSTFSIRWSEPLDWEEFKAWLESLLLARGDSILRMKGLLNVRGDTRPMIVQGVQHSLYPPTHLPAWPEGGPRTELVFITLDFPREAALRSFQQFFSTPVARTACR